MEREWGSELESEEGLDARLGTRTLKEDNNQLSGLQVAKTNARGKKCVTP